MPAQKKPRCKQELTTGPEQRRGQIGTGIKGNDACEVRAFSHHFEYTHSNQCVYTFGEQFRSIFHIIQNFYISKLDVHLLSTMKLEGKMPRFPAFVISDGSSLLTPHKNGDFVA